MSELVSRQVVLAEVREWFDQRGIDGEHLLAVLEQIPSESGWISVEKRLPEHEVRVQLGYSRMQFVDLGYLDREDMDWYDEYDNRVARPTHWMPLHEPPKEDA